MTYTLGIKAYQRYLAVMHHFNANNDYDFVKYRGKFRVSEETFKKNRARWGFAKLEKDLTDDELTQFFYANYRQGILGNPKMVTTPMAKRNYARYLDSLEQLPQKFEEEFLMAQGDKDVRELFAINGEGTHPKIFVDFLREEVSLETYLILDALTGFIQNCSEKVNDPFVWVEKNAEAKRHLPFLNIDPKVYEKILKRCCTVHNEPV